MVTRYVSGLIALVAVLAFSAALPAADPPHPVMTWVKRHPVEGAAKPSPRMGYETTYGYDPVSRLLVRYGGHNQGGGGEQNAEVWTYDLDKDIWALMEANDAPPGVCCGQQNVFDEAARRFVRFPSFSGSHGWQSYREIRLKDSSAWTYDLATNTWRNMRPCPGPFPHPLRGAAWDPHHQVTVIHGGETANHGTVVYDLYANTWTQMKPPDPKPEPNLSQPGFTYDAVRRVFVLFGSQFDRDERTWVYDLRKNRWSVLEVVEHPSNKVKEASPVLAADTRNGIILCSIRGEDRQLQTWALDVEKRQWTRLNLPAEPDPSGSRNRVITYLADRNLFVLENRTGGDEGKQKSEQQIWTFRYAEALAPPQPPDLAVKTEKGAAVLSWNAPPGGAAAWNVYRGEGARPWEVALQAVARGVKGETFKDTGLKEGGIYIYQVRPADAEGKEGPLSRLARTQPPVVTDVVASVVGEKRVELQWPKAAAEDVVGYHVERADVAVYANDQVRRIKDRYKDRWVWVQTGRTDERGAAEKDRHEPTAWPAVGAVKSIGAFRRLTSLPVSDASYPDGSIDLASGQKEPAEPLSESRPLHKDGVDAGGKPYRYAACAYRVVAVNRLGTESGPSPLVFTWPSAVQYLFSKEEGKDAARLKWKANPEKGLQGYLVYRHDGRYDKELIARLTPEPIAATEFLDPASGTGTRRYEVVAVDALGQEGEPSQPVWSRREWARFYVPYVGEWHQ